MPATLAALREYVAEMSAALTVSNTAREIARELLSPLPGTGPAMPVAGQLTSGLLHPHLRQGFGLGWGPVREAQLRTMQAASRALLTKLPKGARGPPAFVMPARPTK